MDLGDALAWLDRHQNLERILADPRLRAPDPARMRRLVDVLGNPESACPAIHVTGTNGKTSTSRAITALLMGQGLVVGTFTSPHLERINERISVNGEPIADDDLAGVLSDLAGLEPVYAGAGGSAAPNWFELLAAAALRWFSDAPVDVMVVEVGLGGRWDATNVVDGAVAVVTNIGHDHLELLGPTLADVAREKAGIVKPGSTLVLGETDASLLPIFEAEAPSALWWTGREYGVARNEMAVGGRVLDLYTPGARYDGVWLDLHGRHQGANFAAAVAAVEAFFAAPLVDDVVRSVAASLRSPGRLEVVSRRPTVVLDGAKNVEGAAAASSALAEEFGEAARTPILVVGMLAGKDAGEMLAAMGAASARMVVACPPPSPRAQPASVVAAAARRLGVAALEAESVDAALSLAVGAAGVDDVILVTGSLYVVGAARALLGGHRPS